MKSGSSIFDMLSTFLRRLSGGAANGNGAGSVSREEAWTFVDRVMRTHHFTPGAQQWLRANVNLRVDDLSSTRGGGYWQPATREVRLFTGQDEAAVHELAHAWWHDRRHPVKDQMIEATVRLSEERDPRYSQRAKWPKDYGPGIPGQNGPGCRGDAKDG